MPTLPIVKPLILCNDVVQDSDNDNVHLIGVFDSIRPNETPAYPHTQTEVCVFVQLSNAVGAVPIKVKIVDAASLDTVFQTSTHLLQFAHWLHVVRTCFRIRDCTFSAAGVCWIEVYCDEKFVADHRFQLL